MSIRVVLVALVAIGGATACVTPGICSRGWALAHPTMDPAEMTIGIDDHVHAASEGATAGATARSAK